MLITMQMMYIGHFKNQQYDQYLDPSFYGKKQYKQKCLQHIHINGNHQILSLIDPRANHYKYRIFDSNKPSNKILNYKTF